MMQNLSSAAPVTGDVGDQGISVPHAMSGRAGGQRKSIRGSLALGFLILSAAMSYGIVFVLIDKWYKGGSLGLL